MKSIFQLVIVCFLVLTVLNCKSAPETEAPPEEPIVKEVEKPVEETKPEEPEPVVVEEKVVQPVTDQEVAVARNAIARAEEVEADYYEPEVFAQAKKSFNNALKIRDTDPDKAREYLSEARKKADLAYENSVDKAVEMFSQRLERSRKKLLSMDADKFLPGEYGEAVAGINKAQALYDRGDLSGANDQAYESLKAMSDLAQRLDERLRWIGILKRDTNQYLTEAENLGADRRAPLEYERANQLYWQGIEDFQDYKLLESEENLGSAREAALTAVKLSRGKAEQEKEQTDTLMLEVMREIEEAAGLTIVTDEGTVVEPEAWTGEEFIEEEESEKDKGDNSSQALPLDNSTVVLADITEENLLTQAKELWKRGVAERNNGNYQVAVEYFKEAQRLIAIYKSLAVDPDSPLYVVRLIPERRDCLWRIAEYEFVYGNPYLWPRIWRRNRKLIQHPDLIYPGWKLVIPPK
jgi:nucleoid-associated protein YgaU